MVIHNLQDAANALRQALDREDPDAIQAAQINFSRSVRLAWERYQQGDVTVSVRGLPLVMYQWAVEELPEQIHDPAAWLRVHHEVGRFLRIMDLVIQPQEQEGK